jgi:hypothetical protein
MDFKVVIMLAITNIIWDAYEKVKPGIYENMSKNFPR